MSQYTTKPGYWEYSRGLVFDRDKVIGDVKRNYGRFAFGWAEGHANGHDYLLCGEDYQGQTVIELDTAARSDYIPACAEEGIGFCCVDYYPSPDRRTIVISGCIWACPNDLVFCRFDQPMSLPWPVLTRLGEVGPVVGWTDKGFEYRFSRLVRLSDMMILDDLATADMDEALGHDERAAGKLHRQCLWVSEMETLTLSERIVPHS
ncbi:MAG: hypothetical protein JXL80_07000 [Planctomycetes bacterium]|nr:hypothetical protein [Planctomycetota bacterium]